MKDKICVALGAVVGGITGIIFAITLPGGGASAATHTVQNAYGCQTVVLTDFDQDNSIPFHECYGLKTPPPGYVWQLVIDGSESLTINKSTVILDFPIPKP